MKHALLTICLVSFFAPSGFVRGTLSADDFETVELPIAKSPRGVRPVAVVFTPEDRQSIVLKQLFLK